MSALATADDRKDADGSTVLDYDQAQQRARSVAKGLARGDRNTLAPVTVTDAIADYLEFQQDHRKPHEQTRTNPGCQKSISTDELSAAPC